jgi:uncharacterized RDD family membrane protein YckC
MENQILDYQEQKNEENLVPVSNGVRFANYLIDAIFFYITFIVLISVFVGSDGAFLTALEENPILDRIITLVCYAIFMTIQETLLKGRSIGKYITGTKVVDYYGTTPTTGTLIARNMYRAVPFDQLSFLGDRGWHDSWSDTYVVKA